MPSPRSPHLSLVIPAFDETARIGPSLREMAAYLAEQPFASELLVVDDGSRDGTFEVLRELAPSLPVPLRGLRCARNRGKGHAIKVGVAAAAGERVLFSDADLSTPIEESERLLAALDAGADVAIGSRKIEGANITVHQPWLRERMGKAFTWLVNRLLVDVSDVTCGFKAFRSEVARDLFSRLRIDAWSFDAELLFLCRQRGYALVEVPVRWHDEAGSRVRLGRDVLGSLAGLLRIRWNAARGVYAEPCPAEPPAESFASAVADSGGVRTAHR